MIPHYQIPRNTLLCLFVTQVLVLLPHIYRAPLWVSLLIAVCMLWRIQVFRGHWPFPKTIIKVPLTLATCFALILSFPSFFGLEALVSVLLVAYGLKLLEMYHKRDALILLYLSFFIVTTSFLFDQGIVLAAFNLFVLCVITTTLMGLYQSSGYEYPMRTFRKAASMVLQAIPLMILMFVVFPRFPSFWNIPLQKNTPKTGMSDTMSPGDFTRLTQTSDPVMRITFNTNGIDHPIPESKELYWRGLTFSKFDGRRWQRDDSFLGKPKNAALAYKLSDNRNEFIKNIEEFGLYENKNNAVSKIDYEVILEPTETPWLYALSMSIPNTSDIWVSYDQVLAKNGYVNTRFKYEVSSYLSQNQNISLPDWQIKAQTYLPSSGNPRARKRAEEWFREAGSVESYIDKLLTTYHNDFYYTLKPPLLGNNSIDAFLFDSKKGFCEHFASSFVFMLRAAGIPARVVVGYQGGELNPYEHYLLVRQYDAHAWAEVWLAGKGWVRYDPTFSVAPKRILDGFRDTFEDKGEFDLPLLSMERYHASFLINFVRLRWDSLNYNWTRFVLSYDSESQLSLLSKLVGDYSVGRVALAFSAVASLFLSIVYLFFIWQERDRTRDPVLKLYRQFCKKMQKKGFVLAPNETPNAFIRRVAIAYPERRVNLEDAIHNLYQYWYQNPADDKKVTELLRKQLSV